MAAGCSVGIALRLRPGTAYPAADPSETGLGATRMPASGSPTFSSGYYYSNMTSIHCGQYTRYVTPFTKMDASYRQSRGRSLLYKAARQASRHSVTVRLNVRMGRTSGLSVFERGMIVGASISETAGLLGFSRTTVSRVYREWCDKQTTNVLWAGKTSR